MGDEDRLITSSGSEILDVLGAKVAFAMSDGPWHFTVSAATGERVTVWVDEFLREVWVRVEDGPRVPFQSVNGGATSMIVSRDAPQISCEFRTDDTAGRLLVTLTPHLQIESSSRLR